METLYVQKGPTYKQIGL